MRANRCCCNYNSPLQKYLRVPYVNESHSLPGTSLGWGSVPSEKTSCLSVFQFRALYAVNYSKQLCHAMREAIRRKRAEKSSIVFTGHKGWQIRLDFRKIH